MFGPSMRRGALTAGFALSMLAAPAVAAVSGVGAGVAPLAQGCPSSETHGPYTADCVPGVDPAPGAVTPNGPNQLPQTNGVYCTNENTGSCIGLGRVPQPPNPQPDTRIAQNG